MGTSRDREGGDWLRALQYRLVARGPLVRTTRKTREGRNAFRSRSPIASFIQAAKQLVFDNDVSPETLDSILERLNRLAGQRAPWSESDFPSPARTSSSGGAGPMLGRRRRVRQAKAS